MKSKEERNAEYYKRNKKKILERNKKWDKKNPEVRYRITRKWVKANPELVKKQRARFYKKNLEKVKAQQSKYRLKHKEETKLRNAKYYLLNKEKLKKDAAQYQKTNPDKCKAYQASRRAQKSKAGGAFTTFEWKNLCKRYKAKCLRCRKSKKLEADHVVPISKGGTSNITNIQPLCRSCNSKKGTKCTDYRKGTHAST